MALVQWFEVVRVEGFFSSGDWKCLLLHPSHCGLVLVHPPKEEEASRPVNQERNSWLEIYLFITTAVLCGLKI